jgi:hypothetical protein
MAGFSPSLHSFSKIFSKFLTNYVTIRNSIVFLMIYRLEDLETNKMKNLTYKKWARLGTPRSQCPSRTGRRAPNSNRDPVDSRQSWSCR